MTTPDWLPEAVKPSTVPGALLWALIFLVLAAIARRVVRGVARRGGRHFPDPTAATFLAQLLQPLAQLLGAQRVLHFHRPEALRGKKRQAGEVQRLALGERVAQLQGAVVRDADDVAGHRLLHQLASLGHESHHRLGPHFLA